jgi:tetratricopeptide (TPR) repeat protein
MATLSEAYLSLGELAQARSEIDQAVRLQTEFYDRNGRARSLCQLSRVLLAMGDRPGAGQAWREAAALFAELGNPAAPELDTLRAELGQRLGTVMRT